MRTVELRRHTAAENDVLTPEGVEAALTIGAKLAGGYAVAVSSGAQRSTQTLACFLAGLGRPVPGGVVVDTGFRSENEPRWFELAGIAAGGSLAAFLDVDRAFVEAEAGRLAAALRRTFDVVPDGGSALVVGHSPMNEAAVFGLTGRILEPISKGAGVLVREDAGTFEVRPPSP
jgi:broad specificity phosphatase PhoE